MSQLRVGLVVVVLGAVVVLTGPALAAPGQDARCGTRSLRICTAERVAELERQRDLWAREAAAPGPEGLTPEQAKELDRYRAWLRKASERAGSLAAVGRGSLPAAGGGGQSQLLTATKDMQETQMSFNLQFLQLQSEMQNENRSFTMISNIMKTKHDTVKNSISNVR